MSDGWIALIGAIVALVLAYQRLRGQSIGTFRGRRTSQNPIQTHADEKTAYTGLAKRREQREQAKHARMEAIRAQNMASSPEMVRTGMLAADAFDMKFVELAAIGREWRGGAFGKKNSSRTARDIIYGFYGKFPVVMFNYAYADNDELVQQSITGVYTSCIMPLIDITREPNGGNTDKFRTESEAFNNTFKVTFDLGARSVALQAIPPLIMDYMLQNQHQKTELWIEQGWIFTAQPVISSYASLDAYEEHLRADFDYVTDIVRMFPPYLAKERQNPDLVVYGFQPPGITALQYVRDLIPAIKDTPRKPN